MSLRFAIRQVPEGGRNQYHTPSVSIASVSRDCQNPQYHAEKTTATHARWYGLWSPRSGTSALRSRRAATAARTANTYRKAFWLGSLGSDSSKACNQRFRISDLEFELPTAQSNLFQE